MSSRDPIIITGSSGFIGQYAISYLSKSFNVTGISLRNFTPSQLAFQGVKTIIHLAGMAHQMDKKYSDEYFKINHRLTIDCATHAKKEGINHFIFISSTKVYGDHFNSYYYDESSECRPTDPYGESKYLAERDLLNMADENFIVSIIRPPLVYGVGVKGNLDNLINLINNVPILPFSCIQNQRSMVFLGNLLELIIAIVKQRKGGIFVAGDSSNYSTSELVYEISKSLGKKRYFFSLPQPFRILLSKFKPDLYYRLFGNFVIDNKLTNKSLNFVPPYSFRQGISEMVHPYKMNL
jgi:UDP-glucose 4-epimerase